MSDPPRIFFWHTSDPQEAFSTNNKSRYQVTHFGTGDDFVVLQYTQHKVKQSTLHITQLLNGSVRPIR